MLTALRNRVRSLALILFVVATASGCVVVPSYQRDKLSSVVMRADPDSAERKLDGHVYEYREGSIGGAGVGGGGCGCN